MLQKYQEVTIPRTSRINQYKGKTGMRVELVEVGNFANTHNRVDTEIDTEAARVTPMSAIIPGFKR